MSIMHFQNEKQNQFPSLKEENCIKTKICKENFENITVFSSSVEHEAVLFSCERPFVFIRSAYPNAVNLMVAEGLRATRPISKLPLYFGSLSDGTLCLAAVRSTRADDLVCMHILAYLASIGHAEYGKDYRYHGSIYRAESTLWVRGARTRIFE